MILGAAALGAKAAFDKVADAFQKDEDSTEYKTIDESYASPTETQITPLEEQSPIESKILDTEVTNEDLQSPATIASSYQGDREDLIPQQSPVSEKIVHEEFQHEDIPVEEIPLEHKALPDDETRYGVVESEPVEYHKEHETHIDRPVSDALRHHEEDLKPSLVEEVHEERRPSSEFIVESEDVLAQEQTKLEEMIESQQIEEPIEEPSPTQSQASHKIEEESPRLQEEIVESQPIEEFESQALPSHHEKMVVESEPIEEGEKLKSVAEESREVQGGFVNENFLKIY